MPTATDKGSTRQSLTLTDANPVQRIIVPETPHKRSTWLVEFEDGRTQDVYLQHTEDEAEADYRKIDKDASPDDLYTVGTYVRTLPLYLRRASPGTDATVVVVLTRVMG